MILRIERLRTLDWDTIQIEPVETRTLFEIVSAVFVGLKVYCVLLWNKTSRNDILSPLFLSYCGPQGVNLLSREGNSQTGHMTTASK